MKNKASDRLGQARLQEILKTMQKLSMPRLQTSLTHGRSFLLDVFPKTQTATFPVGYRRKNIIFLSSLSYILYSVKLIKTLFYPKILSIVKGF